MVKLKQNASTLHSLELNSSRFGNLLLKGKSRSRFIRWCLRWKTGSGFIENTDNFLPTCVILLQRMGTGGESLQMSSPWWRKGVRVKAEWAKAVACIPAALGEGTESYYCSSWAESHGWTLGERWEYRDNADLQGKCFTSAGFQLNMYYPCSFIFYFFLSGSDIGLGENHEKMLVLKMRIQGTAELLRQVSLQDEQWMKDKCRWKCNEGCCEKGGRKGVFVLFFFFSDSILSQEKASILEFLHIQFQNEKMPF